jgi:hypothetical protein
MFKARLGLFFVSENKSNSSSSRKRFLARNLPSYIRINQEIC